MRAMQQEKRYQALVFQHAPPSRDFACSTEIALPGQHTAQGAWNEVYAAMRAPGGTKLVGGTIRRVKVFAESDAEAKAEMLLIQ